MDIRVDFDDSWVDFSHSHLPSGHERPGLYGGDCEQIFTDIHLCKHFGYDVLVMGIYDVGV